MPSPSGQRASARSRPPGGRHSRPDAGRPLRPSGLDLGAHGSHSGKSPRRREREGRAQGLVEFALVLPVMFLILLVAVDFGRLFFTYIQVNNAAREAAAVASTDLDYPNLYDRAAQESNTQGQGGEGALTVGPATCETATNPPVVIACPPKADAAFVSGSGAMVSVSVSKAFTFLTPIVSGFFPGGVLNVGASATAPVVVEAAASVPGGGGSDDPCAVVADFTYSQSAWNKEVDFDATASTPTSSACPEHDPIKNYSWTWDDTSPPSGSPDKTVTSALVKGSGMSGKDAQIFHVTLKVTTVNGRTATFQQDVLTVNK